MPGLEMSDLAGWCLGCHLVAKKRFRSKHFFCGCKRSHMHGIVCNLYAKTTDGLYVLIFFARLLAFTEATTFQLYMQASEIV